MSAEYKEAIQAANTPDALKVCASAPLHTHVAVSMDHLLAVAAAHRFESTHFAQSAAQLHSHALTSHMHIACRFLCCRCCLFLLVVPLQAIPFGPDSQMGSAAPGRGGFAPTYTVAKAMLNKAVQLMVQEEAVKAREARIVATCPGWCRCVLGLWLAAVVSVGC